MSNCGSILVLVLLALTSNREASASEQPVIATEAAQPDPKALHQRTIPAMPVGAAPALTIPATYSTAPSSEARTFSSDFRPHGPSIFDVAPAGGAVEDTPMLHGTTVWQRLEDFRSHGRVQLLTLWETGGSSVSLQAGRKGEPSLQWTSRLMNRGGATRGVLDQLFSVSLASAGRGLNLGPDTGSSEPANKPSKPSKPSKPMEGSPDK
jgi:hypothetical protein